MVDTVRTQSDLLTALFQDGQAAGAISEQDMRDLIVSLTPDMAGYYWSSTSQTNVTSAGTYLKAAGTTAGTTTPTSNLSYDSVSNRIKYTGAPGRHFHIVAQASIGLSAGTNQDIGIGVYHWDDSASSGALLPGSEAHNTQAGTDDAQVTTHADVVMDTNDYIELWITNHTSAANDPTVDFGYVFAMGMIM
jgi:hypothetical protein